MKEMDQIYMLEAGSIVATGTHTSLIEQPGPYKDFLNWRRGDNDA